MKEERNSKIFQEWRKGWTTRQLADRYHVSRGRIQQIVRHQIRCEKFPAREVEVTLKPCPFCKTAPKLMPWHHGTFAVTCISDLCAARPAVYSKTKKDAATAWNTRKKLGPAKVDAVFIVGGA